MAAAPSLTPEPSSTMRVERFDISGRLGKFERTPSGGLRIPAYISRTGVQLYQDADGRTIREYRPASEVLSEDSYRSFEGAPVTVEHPPELVSPSTWRTHAVGVVQNARPDGNRVAADLVIEDAETIRRIEAGDLVETSAGYEAQLVDSPGTADGEPYDAVQQAIRGNHVALGPEGWGRAGPSVRLRIDAAREINNSAPSPAPEKRSDSVSTRSVKVDGIDFEAGSESHIQAVDRLVGRLTTERDSAVTRADAAEKQVETLTKERDAATERADAAMSEEELDSRINKRLGLVDKARRFLGDDYKWAGKSDRQIMGDALKKAGHKVADDASDDRIGGMFDAIVSKAPAKADEGDDDGEGSDGDDGGENRGDSFTVSTKRQDAKAKPYVMPSLTDKWRR